MSRPHPLPSRTTLASIACAAVLTAAATAQFPGGPPGFGGGPMLQPHRTTAVVARFDGDGNGRLDRTERQAAKVWLAENRTERAGPGGRGGPQGMPPFPGGPGFPGGEQPTSDRKAQRVQPGEVATFAGRPFFDPDIVRTVFLTFDEDDWFDELTAFYHTDVLLPATVTIDGESWRGVGARFRGNTSYQMARGKKKSFDLTFDFVHDKQEVFGLRNLDLLNCNQDPSLLREALHGWVCSHYLAAPRVALVRVVVNGEDHGVYAATEEFDKGFQAAHFGSKKGDRFKVPPDFSGNGGLRYLGDDPAAYRRNYVLKSADEAAAWTALVDLCAVLALTPGEDLERILPQHLDVEQALWFLAVDNALADDDGYHSRGSDYNLYRDPKGRFHPVARDNNEILPGQRRGPGPRGGFPGMPGMPGEQGREGDDARGGRADRGDRRRGPGGPGAGVATSPLQMAEREDRPLLHRLLEVPHWRARYLANLRELATGALAPEVIGPRLEAWRKAIDPLVAVEVHSQSGYEPFRREFVVDAAGQPAAGSLLAVIAARRKAILDDGALRGEWPTVADLVTTVDRQGDQATVRLRCRVGGTAIDSVMLYHDRGDFGLWATAELFDDGRHGDGAARDGVYGGELPPAKAGHRWRYWIEARAASGHVARLPAGGGALPNRWELPQD